MTPFDTAVRPVSKTANRRSCLPMSRGLKVRSWSRGASMRSAPVLGEQRLGSAVFRAEGVDASLLFTGVL
jgi:hypothetical protein